VLSVDGTMLEFPNCNELKEYYGLQLGQLGSVGRVRARTLWIYETLTKEQIDYLVKHKKMPNEEEIKTDEKELTLEELKAEAKAKKIKGYSKMNKKELQEEFKKYNNDR